MIKFVNGCHTRYLHMLNFKDSYTTMDEVCVFLKNILLYFFNLFFFFFFTLLNIDTRQSKMHIMKMFIDINVS